MYSSTPSLDSSLVLKLSGSSSTSPSRLPRMLVLYHPETPSIRALNIGESTVLSIVWPVLKSLPPIATPLRLASCSRAGMSQVRFGAPLAKGTPSMIAAQAYSIEGAIEGSFASIAFSKALRVWWVGSGEREISEKGEQTTTRQLQRLR